jgi:hypothetical protein
LMMFYKLKYVFLNPHNLCKCNVGCITHFLRLIITPESPVIKKSRVSWN